MTSVSTPAQSRALAPAARRQRAVTSSGKNPNAGPRNLMARRRVLVMSGGLTAH